MGLLDRFKKEPGPDALTWEAVARARATPGVASAEPVDADTVEVRWTEHAGTTALSLAEVRPDWAKASGFARIELMDQVIAGLAPPTEPPADIPAPTPTPAAPEPEPADAPPASGWARERERIDVVVGRPGQGHGPVRWPLAGGVVEARATLDGGDVTDADLERWAVDADQVRSAAVERLLGADPGLDPIGPGQPAWVPTSPVGPPPAWLAAPARLLAACGLDRVVALAPLPTELVVIDPEATELLASILSSTAGIVEGADDVLLAAPLLLSADSVRVWAPADDHPCAGLVERLRAAGPPPG
ncbi:MAG: hypothetical protein ACLGIC_08730 [Acidimicrobiia bacterium]